MSVVIPVILCGGSGTRLWPLSRRDRPKQFISLFGDQTLLEGTLLRSKTIRGAMDPICVTAETYGSEVRQSLNRLGLGGKLLLEPEPRGTASALVAAALVARRIDPSAIIVALPADHFIREGEAFAASIARACAAAAQGWLSVLGVIPRHASSALGYIVPADAIDGLPQVNRVRRFTEKPAPAVAESLVASGALWNAGIVVARADTVIAAMREHEPAGLEAVERSQAHQEIQTDDVRLDQTYFADAPRISFDKAVLEKHDTVAVTALDAEWRDVGTWAEVAELSPADVDGNRHEGRVSLSSSQNSFVLSPHRLTVGIGLKELVVVDTPDALLIANRNDLGLVREVVEALSVGLNTEVSAGDRTVSAVGYAKSSASDETVRSLRVFLEEGDTICRQPHQDVLHHWIVLQGSVQVTLGGLLKIFNANEGFNIGPGFSHSLANVGASPAKLIEVHVLVNDLC